jgi:hypothetical protein
MPRSGVLGCFVCHQQRYRSDHAPRGHRLERDQWCRARADADRDQGGDAVHVGSVGRTALVDALIENSESAKLCLSLRHTSTSPM